MARRFRSIAGAVALMSMILALMWARGCSVSEAESAPTEVEAIAEQAYVYGYPLVVMTLAGRAATNVSKPDTMRAPINEWTIKPALPTPKFDGFPQAEPDMVIRRAWLDLAVEPVVLQVSSVRGRYFQLQLIDAWTNVFKSIGKRTTGVREQTYVLVGPRWHGRLPSALKAIKTPTSLVWILARFQVAGPHDIYAAEAAAMELKLTPLSEWGQPRTVPARKKPTVKGVDSKTHPVDQVATMDADSFFTIMARQMWDNPPAASDGRLMAVLASIGIEPGKPFTTQGLNPAAANAIRLGATNGLRRIKARSNKLGLTHNGWQVMAQMGSYGADHLKRAAVAHTMLGANLSADVVCLRTSVDGAGAPLTGKHRYVMRLAGGQIPPSQAGWSIAIYDAKGRLVRNSLKRYALSDTAHLATAPGGAVDILIQRDEPEGRTSNWLPAPKGEFSLTMRIRWPGRTVLEGQWSPPPVVRVESEAK